MAALAASAADGLLVISVDGLDQRYLSDADRLGLKIPRIRKLLREGQWSAGVVGVVPTVTWPSHTTMISGVPSSVHGILGNRRPASDGGDYYWNADLLKARTLLDAAKDAGLSTAAVTWPVTVDAPVTFNLPEYFKRRRGGAMDLPSIESKSRPEGLVKKIGAMFPSFTQEWMDDRTRAQAVVYLLKTEKPRLTLLHFVDLDSEAHDNGPFTREANAILEYTDELIGQMLDVLPKGYAVALVSDHGFEKVESVVNLPVLAGKSGVSGVRAMGGIAVADSKAAAEFLRSSAKDPKLGIGREIPKAEVARFDARLSSAEAVFEPLPGFQFGQRKEELFAKPEGVGNHGHWPSRYRAVYALWGPGVKAERLPEIEMTSIASRLASTIGLAFTPSGRGMIPAK